MIFPVVVMVLEVVSSYAMIASTAMLPLPFGAPEVASSFFSLLTHETNKVIEITAKIKLNIFIE